MIGKTEPAPEPEPEPGIKTYYRIYRIRLALPDHIILARCECLNNKVPVAASIVY